MNEESLSSDDLVHQLRNRLNLIGFALHAYGRDGDPAHIDTIRQAYEAAAALLEDFNERLPPQRPPAR